MSLKQVALIDHEQADIQEAQQYQLHQILQLECQAQETAEN